MNTSPKFPLEKKKYFIALSVNYFKLVPQNFLFSYPGQIQESLVLADITVKGNVN